MNAARTLALLYVLAVTAPHSLGSAYAQGALATPAAVQALAGQHPAEYYKRAGELFKRARKTTASSSSTSASFAIARFCCPSPTAIRPPIRQSLPRCRRSSASRSISTRSATYPGLARTIDAVLAYDTANPDTFAAACKVRQDSRRRSQWADGDENEDARRGGPNQGQPAKERIGEPLGAMRIRVACLPPLQHQQRDPIPAA